MNGVSFLLMLEDNDQQSGRDKQFGLGVKETVTTGTGMNERMNEHKRTRRTVSIEDEGGRSVSAYFSAMKLYR